MADSKPGTETKRIKSVRTAFDIIEIIKWRSPIRATDIAAQLEYSDSTVHYHLKTLRSLGYLVKHEDGYRLGIRFLHLGGYALISKDILYALNTEISALAMDVGESVQVAIEEFGKGYYVHHTSDVDAAKPNRHIGTEVYLHSTAAGKAILAELPPNRVNEIIERHGLPAVTEHTITSRSSLVTELQRIRERGVAFGVQEFSEDETGIGVPLRIDSEVIGALELALPPTRIPDPRQRSKEERFPEELINLVVETARLIEE